MKTSIFSLIIGAMVLFSCSDDSSVSLNNDENKVLLLKVDYTTNVFEGGKELTFNNAATTFTVEAESESAADFGWVKLFYAEENALLFDGDIVWMGLGTINYPENMEPASAFDIVITNDYIYPQAGFENVFNPSGQEYNYEVVWSAAQSVVKARQFLESNPTATVKLFLYTPSVGIGNPEEWDWILILKN